ncbi:MAG: ABC transporter substrate-binding protein [Firmicutes bacterium]|nr:ABC transporter substrate-binding protein [Bacillota bacterium]
MKKFLALLLALTMVLSLCACTTTGGDETDGSTSGTESTESTGGTDTSVSYTYTDSVSTLASNWNIHTYQTSDDAYPIDTAGIVMGLYTFVFNDELHPVDGLEPYEGYAIIPEMAAEMPVDITEQVKEEHPEYGIPESATEGYAYSIALNPNATWDDGTPINADTYVESMERLLRAELLNYRATDYYSGSLSIAGAEEYANSGLSTYKDNDDADANPTYTLEDLVLGADGQYTDPDGNLAYLAVNYAVNWLGGYSITDYVDAYGDAYFDTTNWEALTALVDDDGVVPLTDDNLALFSSVVATEAWAETADTMYNYVVYAVSYAEVSFDTVGIYKTDEYEIVLVLDKALTGFNLYYALTGNWIVKIDLYDECLSETDGVWTSTYCTSVETTPSCGPYVMTSYQADKAMHFAKNENWYGYTDGLHVYVDPVDGQTYDMYMTTEIDCQVVSEAATRKMMFLSGELMTYGLQSDDFDEYRNSEYCYASPADTIFFLIVNGDLDMLQAREAAADFDQTTSDLETITLLNFRKALALFIDKDNLASTVSPARSAAYGIVGNTYICDPDTGLTYRETDQAKQVLCDFYSVDVSEYASLDDAVNSITGYDLEKAKEYFALAFQDALDAGYITDTDGDGICDQSITLEYSMSSDSDFMTQTIDYLNEKLAEATSGTPFEGKVSITKSAPYGNDWSTKIKNGESDCVLAGWTGSRMNPYGLTDLYVNPSYAYDGGWFDATTVTLTLTVPVDGVDTTLTMTMWEWSDALNGTTVTVDGVEYNFGSGIADMDTRLTILAAIEGAVLQTYDYLPMMQDSSRFLLSQKAFYVVEEYNGVMGRGGIQYMRYNYNDTEWTEYVASQGGTLQY